MSTHVVTLVANKVSSGPGYMSAIAVSPFSSLSECTSKSGTNIEDPCGLVGQEVEFSDGSRWLFWEPLSEMRLQRIISPCEATQVFLTVCQDDPPSKHVLNEEAVIKIKFQYVYAILYWATANVSKIKSTTYTRSEYEEGIADREESLTRHPKYEIQTQEQIDRMREALRACTYPTLNANRRTANEIAVLRHLAAQQYQHAPWLLDVLMLPVANSDHSLGIIGGYFGFTLMTKLHGTRLTYGYMNSLSRAQRDEIREAFKLALM
jgi:hypothetical protein